MFRLRHIETFDEPGLAPYRTMRRPKEHATQGIFVAEGDKVVQRLLQDPRYGIVSVVLPPDRVEEFTPLLQARPEDFDLFIAEKKLLTRSSASTCIRACSPLAKSRHNLHWKSCSPMRHVPCSLSRPTI
jgi:hypothetical protein